MQYEEDKMFFKSSVLNESLHENTDDNCVRVASFTISINLITKNTVTLHRNIHNCNWTAPDVKTQSASSVVLQHRLLPAEL